jgi:hypothetical protein
LLVDTPNTRFPVDKLSIFNVPDSKATFPLFLTLKNAILESPQVIVLADRIEKPLPDAEGEVGVGGGVITGKSATYPSTMVDSDHTQQNNPGFDGFSIYHQ